MGYSISIVNNIRANMDESYQSRVPEATQENLPAVGIALEKYDLLYNQFFPALFGKIGKTILEKKLFKNKLVRFKSGTIHTQQDVEEIFIEMAKAEGSYDPTGPNPLGRREGPDVKAIYHRMNRQDYYAISIGDVDVMRVFRSEGTLDAFISGLINSVYSGANYDEWLHMKNLLASYTPQFKKVEVPFIMKWDGSKQGDMYEAIFESFENTPYAVMKMTDMGTPANIGYCASAEEANTLLGKSFIKQIRQTSMDMSFASTEYNDAGVMTWTAPEDSVLLIHKDMLPIVDVDVLSKAFNMGKTDIQVEIIPVDDFGTCSELVDGDRNALASCVAMLVDRDFFRIWDTLSKMEPQRNAQGLFTNYFYHVHQILSLSKFKNAVMFTRDIGEA